MSAIGVIDLMTIAFSGCPAFVRCSRATSSFSSGFPPQSVGARATRSSSRRYNSSRSSSSSTNTQSNKSMNFEKFRDPPQKKERFHDDPQSQILPCQHPEVDVPVVRWLCPSRSGAQVHSPASPSLDRPSA